MRVFTMLLVLGFLQVAGLGQVLAGPSTGTFYYRVFYFDLVAAKNLTITGFDIKASVSHQPTEVSVWKMKEYGSYTVGEGDPHAWELLHSQTLSWQSSSVRSLVSTLQEFVAAGETQAFYFAVPCDVVLTLPTGSVAASNSDLTLKAGIGGHRDGALFYAPTANCSFGGQINYSLTAPTPVDVAMEAFSSPATGEFDCGGLGVAETVTVRMRNQGSSTLPAGSLLQLDLEIDGSLYVSDFSLTSAAVLPSATFSHTFSASADLSVGSSHDLKATLVIVGDGNATNDQLEMTVHNGGEARITSLPWVEDFAAPGLMGSTAPPAGWYQDPNDSVGPFSQWFFSPVVSASGTNAAIPSTWATSSIPPSTIPLPTRLESPCIDLTTAQLPRLRFDYRNYQSSSFLYPYNLFSVDVIRMSTGMIDIDVEGPLTFSYASNPYEVRIVDLSAYVGDVIKLVLRADYSAGYPSSAIVIDNVRVEESLPAPGQSLQRYFAELRLDGFFSAVNVNGDHPTSRSGGPYFITRNSGSQLSFDFIGAPFQPVLLLSGPLNPVAATFPNIGQMDIGGLPDPMTGIPVGIQVAADGTSPVGLNPLFVLGSSGQLSLWFTIPGLPSGPYANFQAAILTGGANGSWIALSNTIQLSIQ